jgi:hypothetical protein
MPSISTGKAKLHFGRRRRIKIAPTRFLYGNRVRGCPGQNAGHFIYIYKNNTLLKNFF